MPHRAGYFVLAYQWDHHCNDLLNSLEAKFRRIITQLMELDELNPKTPSALLSYYKQWHTNRELYQDTIEEINRKQFVINSLGYRGYGVNYDLLNALEGLKGRYVSHASFMLNRRFVKHIEQLKKTVRVTRKDLGDMDSGRIIKALRVKMKLKPEKHVRALTGCSGPDLKEYFRVMSEQTPWPVNTAIFQKLYLNLGTSSMTIMKGSSGYENAFSEQDLKVLGNRNFLDMYRDTFANLHNFTDIGIDLLKRIHYIISRDIVANAGNFREYDFPDRNGVTMGFGNFERETGDLAHVLRETAWSFDDLDAFVFNLARTYYMFIGIHPFWDSNGRVGKCFLNYMLIKKGLPPLSFSDADELFALPRYGGDMEDMHVYLRQCLSRAVDAYFKERWKLEHFGYLSARIYNVSFDSGFHFMRIDNGAPRLETSFHAFITDPWRPLSRHYMEQCRVTLQDEVLLGSLNAYCGFSHERRGEWEQVLRLTDNFFIHEIESDTPDARVFEVSFILELHGDYSRYRYFNCCIVSEKKGYETRIFNNKGLNYSYEMEPA